MMERTELKSIVEAMIFVAEEPITERVLLEALAEAAVSKEELREAIGVIEREWNETQDRGMQLAQVAGGYQFRTKEGLAGWLRKLNVPKPTRLSGPALETLAIVAYKQPIVRSEIETIRGVDSGGVLKTLLERRLLRIVGRRDEPGQPLLYGTTKEFLEIFNLKTLRELPTLRDIEELAREHRSKGNVPPAGTGEEVTELLPKDGLDDEEEETEVIERRPIDDDEESEKDHEALTHLETTLKDLRRLERSVFPKEKAEQAGEAHAQQNDATATAGENKGGEPLESTAEPADGATSEKGAAAADAPGSDDRPFE